MSPWHPATSTANSRQHNVSSPFSAAYSPVARVKMIRQQYSFLPLSTILSLSPTSRHLNSLQTVQSYLSSVRRTLPFRTFSQYDADSSRDSVLCSSRQNLSRKPFRKTNISLYTPNRAIPPRLHPVPRTSDVTRPRFASRFYSERSRRTTFYTPCALSSVSCFQTLACVPLPLSFVSSTRRSSL